mmetsp:Transcript_37658/g.45427  ORF Transcript_37658/g.45427 Transcript_37658/m.45427 type:complete len:637 (+) Transcript_37658:43-1953(+)|eukprot:CAMPEP_0197846476 /NCGR_PEP_ID=MMETSP1438-20131217/3212_1 /TAXON_ID=1461541 /ORGANISM="Pterosperma sp., Strain CCMP1384" /LENGTH=636 /DNA_ID=CAMNT_0043458147 /DNA_START=37 /DNA_END=1947 /DNA_ORIENTATION=+
MADNGQNRLLPTRSSDGKAQPDAPSRPSLYQRFTVGATIWFGLIGKFVAAAFGAVVLGAGVVLFPIGYLIPNAVLNWLFQCIFKVAYSVYVFTPLGRFIHLQMVKSRNKSHTQQHTLNIKATTLSSCDVLPIPILADNYAYLLVDHMTREAAVVDPADPDLIAQTVEGRKVKLTTILTTHRHHDHAGGNLALKKRYPDLTIVGGKKDGCAGTTMAVGNNDTIKVGNTLITVLETPCHTTGHVCFVVCGAEASPGGPMINKLEARGEALFSGDTLFIGGVGALFHGSEMDMHTAINHTLKFVPDSCHVFCGHEYTLDNVRFAEWLEPDRQEVVARCNWVVKRRSRKESTIPQLLGKERRLNPFMRVRDPSFAVLAQDRLTKLSNSSWWPGQQKADSYRTSGNKYSNNDGSLDPMGVSLRQESQTTQEHLLSDDDAVKVMKKLQKLMSLFTQSAEHHQQLPPCCMHRTCMRQVTCQGVIHRQVLHSMGVQTDKMEHVLPALHTTANSFERFQSSRLASSSSLGTQVSPPGRGSSIHSNILTSSLHTGSPASGSAAFNPVSSPAVLFNARPPSENPSPPAPEGTSAVLSPIPTPGGANPVPRMTSIDILGDLGDGVEQQTDPTNAEGRAYNEDEQIRFV